MTVHDPEMQQGLVPNKRISRTDSESSSSSSSVLRAKMSRCFMFVAVLLTLLFLMHGGAKKPFVSIKVERNQSHELTLAEVARPDQKPTESEEITDESTGTEHAASNEAVTEKQADQPAKEAEMPWEWFWDRLTQEQQKTHESKSEEERWKLWQEKEAEWKRQKNDANVNPPPNENAVAADNNPPEEVETSQVPNPPVTETSQAEEPPKPEEPSTPVVETPPATTATPPQTTQTPPQVVEMPSVSGADLGPLHVSPLPHYTREQILDRRDLYANLHVPTDYQGQNLGSVAGMRTLLKQARDQYWDKLGQQDQYGTYRDRIFRPNGSIGRMVFASVGANTNHKTISKWGPECFQGKYHLIEKLKLKLVQAQLKFLQHGEEPPTKTLTRFVHAHGGHSAAAGHGNFFDESYTAVAEKALRPVLRAIGINYVGRNMAAGATSSGDEVSLCSNAYFGYEMDILTYDYGMTDGKLVYKTELYARRGALRSQLPPLSDDITDIPSRPAIVAVHYNGHASIALAGLERKNLTVAILHNGVRSMALGGVPDTAGIGVQAIVDALPDMVRSFRCNRNFEAKGFCGAAKYNDTICKQRGHKSSWHPGYKMHALEGHLFALGILEGMDEALDQLARLEPEQGETKEEAKVRLTKLFWDLNNKEQNRYNWVINNHDVMRGGYIEGEKRPMHDVVTQADILKLPNFCHIAKLPSDQRFRGLFTENFELTTINVALEQTFDRGVHWSESHKRETSEKEDFVTVNPAPRENELVLVSHTYGKEGDCPYATYIDNKDIYYITSKHGWRGLTLPNDSEQEFYAEYDPKKAKGWVIICFGSCSWGKCDKHDVRPYNKKKADDAGYLEIKINGLHVSGYDDTGGGCHFTKHWSEDPSQRYTWTPNEAGKYDIQVRVAGATSFGFTKLASFVFF